MFHIENESERPLTEIVYPKGWANLAGPFQWYHVGNNQIEKHEEYGKVIKVKPVGKIGAIAQSLHESKDSPYPVILLHGPGGIGKSVFSELLTRSFVSKEHLPVSYTDNEGDTVTLINENTGEPFNIDPVDKGLASSARIKKTLARPANSMAEAMQRNSAVQFFNAGPIGKAQTDEIAASTRSNRRLPGENKRVIIISEFDNLEKRQVPSFKVAFDNKDMPEGVLVLCDTNHLDKVKNAMGSAGMQRFEVISVGLWEQEVLLDYAYDILSHIGISIKTKDQHKAVEEIVERSMGSFRSLLKLLQTVRSLDHFTYDTAIQLLNEENYSNAEASGFAYTFYKDLQARRYWSNAKIMTNTRGLIKKHISPQLFAQSLVTFILQSNNQRIADIKYTDVINNLYDVISYTGPPINEVLWLKVINVMKQLIELEKIG